MSASREIMKVRTKIGIFFKALFKSTWEMLVGLLLVGMAITTIILVGEGIDWIYNVVSIPDAFGRVLKLSIEYMLAGTILATWFVGMIVINYREIRRKHN